MKLMFVFVVILRLCILVCNADVYLKSNGTDTGNCSSFASGCASWQYGTSQLSFDGSESLIISTDTKITVNNGLNRSTNAVSYTIIGQDANTSVLSLKTDGEVFHGTAVTKSISLTNIVLQMDRKLSTLAVVNNTNNSEICIKNVKITNSSQHQIYESYSGLISGNGDVFKLVNLTMINAQWYKIIYALYYRDVIIDGLYIGGSYNSFDEIGYLTESTNGEVCRLY